MGWLIALIVVVALLCAVLVYVIVAKKQVQAAAVIKLCWKKVGIFYQTNIKFPLHLISHPIQGYTEFKEEKKGKMGTAIFILLMYVLMQIIAYNGEGIIINTRNPLNFQSLLILVTGILPAVLIAVANWSVTTLMNGKGRMKEIFMMIGYSFFPVVICGFLNIILSNFLTLDEAGFITLLNIIGWFLTGYMVFMGLIVIHEYGMFKTIISVVLTVVAICIVLFIALLIFDLSQQIYGFIYSLYKEIATRFL